MKIHHKRAAETRRQIADMLDSGEFSAALQLCNGLLRKGTADVDLAEYRARCMAGLERVDDAIAFCRASLKKHRNSLVLADILGQSLLRKGILPEAGKCYETAVRIQPTFLRGWFLLGAIHGRMGNSEQSIHCSRKALELEPGNTDAHYNLANAYMCMHRAGAAVPHYRKVVESWVDSFEAWNHLGMALHESGQHAEAVPCLERALEIRPDEEATRFILAAARGSDSPSVAPKRYVAGLFDDYADKFEQHLVTGLGYRTPELLHELVRRELSVADDNTSGRLCVLDFGCGTGLCGPLFRDVSSRLVGVDLSPGMLEKARAKAVYDELIEGDLVAAIEAGLAGNCDLIVGADVYPYIGAMDETLRQCHSLLRQGGLLAISVEADEGTDTFALHHANRYAHCAAYVRGMATRAGFTERAFEEAVLRSDRGKNVDGYLFVFGKQ